MSIHIDLDKGRLIANKLYFAFQTEGIFGKTEMPEDILPVGVNRGSLEHLLFITLTVSIDYQRDANVLWSVSRTTYHDPETRYLYDPQQIAETPIDQIIEDMQKHKLSKKPIKDAEIWKRVGTSFYTYWQGDPRNFLREFDWDSLLILKELEKSYHYHDGKLQTDFPYLRGKKIGPLWIRMLRDNVGIDQLKNLNKVPIPVDIHVAKATLSTGVVSGDFDGKLDEIFEIIRKAWFQSVKGLNINNRPMIALDIDEPLWHLSKYGCSKRKEDGSCPMADLCLVMKFCTKGKMSLSNSKVTVCSH